MMKLGSIRIWMLLFWLALSATKTELSAQVSEVQARQMLEERGIPEDTLKARLVKKGFNPDNITPDQVEKFQVVMFETIREIESEKAVSQAISHADRLESIDSASQEPGKISVTVIPPAQEPGPAENPNAIYGQEIFRNNSIAVYQKAEDVIAPDSYVLDVGDKIGVIGFGRSQFEEILEILPSGFVQPKDKLPKILLRGIRWGDAKEILFQRYSQYHVFDRGEFLATLVKPRNMTINVFGEAKTTGAFTLPGVNTAFNVISAAGGPTDIGSVRRIKVIRGSKTLPLDVYAFMNDPAVADQFYLQNNDYIHIPVAEKVVRIRGAVTRPMAYELLDQENLVQLIRFAGGALPQGYLSDVQVTRYLDDKRVVTNVNLRELMAHDGDYILYNGDVVDIKRVEDAVDNTVRITGAVVFPGEYEKKSGMRISELIAQAVLKPEARLDFAYILKYQVDGTYKFDRINLQQILDAPGASANALLNNKDMIQVMTLKTYADPGYFSVEGSVKNVGRFSFDPDGKIKVEDAILLAGGLLQDATDQGFIVRANPNEPKQLQYLNINIKQAIEEPASDANVEIRSGDVIRVFSKSSRRDDLFVSVFGAVREPGQYKYAEGMSLADLVNLAGGFTFEADNNRIDIASVDMKAQENFRVTQSMASLPDLEYQVEDRSTLLQPFDHVYVRTLPEFEFQQTVQIAGEVRYPGLYPLVKDKERIYDLITRAGGLTGEAFPEGAKLFRRGDSTGLVVIDLVEILQNKNTPSNIILVKGDVINIPKSKDLVTIAGNVNLDEAYSRKYLSGVKAISVAFRGSKSAKYYIDKFAAGISERGAPSEVKVQYADGRIQRTRQFLFFTNYPQIQKGSQIIVGAKKEKPQATKAKKDTDWAGVLRDTMAQATAVLTLLILVDQLSK